MKIVAFTIAGDPQNLKYAKILEKSFKHFHPDVPFVIYGQEQLDKISDPLKFYKGTPLFAKELIKEYDTVLKLDCDQLILGNLDYIFTTAEYDVGTVLNINRVDPQRYGVIQGWGIIPQQYVNNGFVAMKSKEFVDHWWRLCNSEHFDRLQFKEQDLLNILFYYGNYKTVCFDHYDAVNNYSAWHGLVAKGETVHTIIKDGELVIPRGQDGYPDKEVRLKALHWAGGAGELKMDYQKQFPEEVIEYIDGILK